MAIASAQSELPRLVRHPLSFFARSYWLPLAVLLTAATADCVTTYHNLVLYGPDEAHVVQRWVSEAVGVHAGVPLAKLVQPASWSRSPPGGNAGHPGC